jgi:hypothetical protein
MGGTASSFGKGYSYSEDDHNYAAFSQNQKTEQCQSTANPEIIAPSQPLIIFDYTLKEWLKDNQDVIEEIISTTSGKEEVKFRVQEFIELLQGTK